MELKQELNDISAKFKNLNIKLSSREDELRKTKLDYENRIGEIKRIHENVILFIQTIIGNSRVKKKTVTYRK